MDFSEFCESLEDPIYVGEEKVTCRKGYKYDKKLGKCVPEANSKTSHTQNPGESQLPEPLGGWNTWGATGMNGDGYALEVEEQVQEEKTSDDPKDWPSIKDEKKKTKTNVKNFKGLGIAPTIKEDVPYHRTAKDERRLQDAERKHRDDDNRMRYGKSGKPPEKQLRPGEVRRWDKVQKKWVSNK